MAKKKKTVPKLSDDPARRAARDERFSKAAKRIAEDPNATPQPPRVNALEATFADKNKEATITPGRPAGPVRRFPVPGATAPAPKAAQGSRPTNNSNRPIPPPPNAPQVASSASMSMDNSTKGQRSRGLVRAASASGADTPKKRSAVRKPKTKSAEERRDVARAQEPIKGAGALDTSRAEDVDMLRTMVRLAAEHETNPRARRTTPDRSGMLGTSAGTVVDRARALSTPYHELQYEDMTPTERSQHMSDLAAGAKQQRRLRRSLMASAASLRSQGDLEAASSLDRRAQEALERGNALMDRAIDVHTNRRATVIEANRPREGGGGGRPSRLLARVPDGYDLTASAASTNSGSSQVRFLTQNAETAAKARVSRRGSTAAPDLDAISAPVEMGGYVTPTPFELSRGKVVTRRSQKTLAKRSEREGNRLSEADALEKEGNKKGAEVIRAKVKEGSERTRTSIPKPKKIKDSTEIEFTVDSAPDSMVGPEVERMTDLLRNQLGFRHMTPGRVAESMRAIEEHRSRLTDIQSEPPLGVSGTSVERGGDVRVSRSTNPLTSVDSDAVDFSTSKVGLGRLHTDVVKELEEIKKKRRVVNQELSTLGETSYGSDEHSSKQEEYRKLGQQGRKLLAELKSLRDTVPSAVRKGTVLKSDKVDPSTMGDIDPLNQKLVVTGQGQPVRPTTYPNLAAGQASGVSPKPLQGRLFGSIRGSSSFYTVGGSKDAGSPNDFFNPFYKHQQPQPQLETPEEDSAPAMLSPHPQQGNLFTGYPSTREDKISAMRSYDPNPAPRQRRTKKDPL